MLTIIIGISMIFNHTHVEINVVNVEEIVSKGNINIKGKDEKL